MDPLHDEIYNNQTPTNHISSSFTYLQSVLSVYHLNKYRALRSTCRLSASFVFEEHRASKLASCLRAELLNETTTSCLSACSIEVKESKTHSSHAHLRFWKNFMTCCNGVLCMAASSRSYPTTIDSIDPLASIVTFSDDDWGVQSPPKR